MANDDGVDPWLWPVARVLDELCGSSAMQRGRLPDSETLQRHIEEHEVDGETFLLASDADLAGIFGKLKLKRRTTLLDIRRQWRRRSIGYARHLAAESPSNPSTQEDVNFYEGLEQPDRDGLPLHGSPLHGSPTQRTISPTIRNPLLSAAINQDHIDSRESVAGPSAATVRASKLVDSDAEVAKGKKRKRVAPTALITQDDTAKQLLGQPINETALPATREVAYLDHDSFLFADFVTILPENEAGLTEVNFEWTSTPPKPPPGRRQQVNRLSKRFFRARRSRFGDIVDGNDVEPDFSVLGESDSEIFVDSDTEREIKEDDGPVRRVKPVEELDDVDVNLQIAAILEDFATQWLRTKRWKQEEKGYRIWKDVHRHNTQVYQVSLASKELARLQARLESQTGQLRAMTWSNHGELCSTMESVKPTVFQIEMQRWMLELLQRNTAPPKPPSDVSMIVAPRARDPTMADDEEDLDSGDEWRSASQTWPNGNPMEVDSQMPVTSRKALEVSRTPSKVSFIIGSGGWDSPPQAKPLTELSPLAMPTLQTQNHVPMELESHAREVFNISDDENEDEGEDEDELSEDPFETPRKRRIIVKNQDAQMLRRNAQDRIAEQEARRQILQAQIARMPLMSRDLSRLIINDSKAEDEGFIYVDTFIASRIQDHQIEGVRFLWNQIVATDKQDGCLLAHTMGLGKTMQIVTFLVAVIDAAKADQLDVSSQVPSHLQSPRIVVLCPSGLINNWMDELLLWARPGVLGELRKVTSAQAEERQSEIQAWADGGGVILIGYPMLRALAKTTSKALNDDPVALLQGNASIVIADEAHHFKTGATLINPLMHGFKTKARIAMTGTPLANNVTEYYSMIDWVKPNFLGPKDEFADHFANPIQQGLRAESGKYQRRRALTLLRALSTTVQPKVHRRTMAMLKEALPPKEEFIIYLDLQEVQDRIYRTYVRNMTVSCPLALTAFLGLLLAHPILVKKRLTSEQSMETPGKAKKKKKDQEELTSVSKALANQIRSLLPREEVLQNSPLSYKMMVLFRILEECRARGDNTLVFFQQLAALNHVEAALKLASRSYKRLDGNTAIDKRQAQVKDFNAGRGQVYLISTRAGGVGLNIHGANRVVIFDQGFNPVDELQAIGRAYRIGQQRRVTVYWLVYGGTFEKALLDQGIFKMNLQSRVNDKKNPIRNAMDQVSSNEPEALPHEDLQAYKERDDVLGAIIADDAVARGITSIESRNTFEQEELLDQLSPEEEREAKNIIRMNQLRLENPAEWHRLQESQRQQSALASMSSIPVPGVLTQIAGSSAAPIQSPHVLSGSNPPIARASESQDDPVAAPAPSYSAQSDQSGLAKPLKQMTATQQLAVQHGGNVTHNGQLASNDQEPGKLDSRVGGPAVRFAQSASPAFPPSSRQQQSIGAAANVADAPLLSADTHFRGRSQPPAVAPADNKASTLSLCSALHFSQALASTAAGRASIETEIDAVTSAVVDEMNEKGLDPVTLAAVQKWLKLTAFVTDKDHPEYAKAVLESQLTPPVLVELGPEGWKAHLQKSSVKHSLVASHDSPRPPTTTPALAPRPKSSPVTQAVPSPRLADPNHATTILRRSSSKTNGHKASPHSKSDMSQVEKVQQRRARRQRESRVKAEDTEDSVFGLDGADERPQSSRTTTNRSSTPARKQGADAKNPILLD